MNEQKEIKIKKEIKDFILKNISFVGDDFTIQNTAYELTDGLFQIFKKHK